MKISSNYQWLFGVNGLPNMIQEGIRLGKLDTNEIPGPKSNTEIMKLAKIAGVEKIYTNDDTAWCAVSQTAICILAGKEVPFKSYDRLRAAAFLKIGEISIVPMLGDILVFTRSGGNHVGMYVGEDEKCYHVMGGNQSNQFNIARIEKKRLSGARRIPYKIGMPAAVRQILLNVDGTLKNSIPKKKIEETPISKNES